MKIAFRVILFLIFLVIGIRLINISYIENDMEIIRGGLYEEQSW